MKKVVKKIMDMNSDEKLIGVYDKEKQDRMILNTRLTGARMEGEKIGYQKGESGVPGGRGRLFPGRHGNLLRRSGSELPRGHFPGSHGIH